MSESETVPAATDPTTISWAERAASYAAEAARWNQPYAERLVALTAPRAGERVLDVATGPGVVAIEAARALGETETILATDLEAVWESYVSDSAKSADVNPIRFAAMSADALTLPDASQDVVLCQFGLMFVPEPKRALAEFRRVLKPGGRLGLAVWSTPDKVGVFLPMMLIREQLPSDPNAAPGELPTPLILGAPGLIETMVRDAGFTDVQVEHFTGTSIIDDPDAAWGRWGSQGMMAAALANESPEEQERIRVAVIAGLQPYMVDGKITLESEAILVTARR